MTYLNKALTVFAGIIRQQVLTTRTLWFSVEFQHFGRLVFVVTCVNPYVEYFSLSAILGLQLLLTS